ncbi:13204_t:CDS:2 [Cetraspora pellucida]|uniref:squalene synthase n=1 Tax=Cetraspora pellucida TaxID=1433469 RepID=A0A9N9IF56_9GLOM|nr:13204_t:CDS:2 [Cetraspora pellucida]
MTIPIETKEPLLRSFHEIIFQKGWTFTGCDPLERDRQLLVEFNVVIDEFLSLRKEFRDIIADIVNKMGNGMADYVKDGAHIHGVTVKTIKDFDMYCYYVAGLSGLGLTRLFVASGLESSDLASDTNLSINMGLYLQKTNILRDYLEDHLHGRKYWPEEIWSIYVKDSSDLKEPGYETEALDCLSSVILNILNHVPVNLTYMNKLQNKSVFRFCSIPQVWALATLSKMFRNYETFQKIVKIRRGEAVKCTSIHDIANFYLEYTRVIIHKNDRKDPNFMKISAACGKIEQWCTTNLQVTKDYNKTLKKDWLNHENDLLLFIGFSLLTFTYWKQFRYDGLEY